jgi:hypothetical protein
MSDFYRSPVGCMGYEVGYGHSLMRAFAGAITCRIGWLIENLIVCIALVLLALSFLTPMIREHELVIRHYGS